MASYNDVKNGDYIEFEGEPFMIMDRKYIHMQQRRPTYELKLRNLRTGQNLTRTVKADADADEAEIEKTPIKFVYEHRGEYFFADPKDAKNRFALAAELLGDSAKFLKPNIEVTALKYNDAIINIQLPIKIDYKIIEAPPGIKGDTASGGGKSATIEGGAKVNVPLFINPGDVVRINTQTGEYVERVEKSSF